MFKLNVVLFVLMLIPIDSTQVLDKYVDKNRSDAVNLLKHKRQHSYKKTLKCDKDQFACDDKNQCVEDWKVCKTSSLQYAKCADGSDTTTAACEAVCIGPNKFLCKDKSVCISKSYECDGFTDCADGSDEKGCKDERECEHNFKCSNGQGCLSRSLICDGNPECLDGSDEADCEENKCFHNFLCVNNKKCFSMRYVCNGYDNCGDGSDERKTKEECRDLCTSNGGLMCDDNSKCLHPYQICDHVVNCNDASDEKGCRKDQAPSSPPPKSSSSSLSAVSTTPEVQSSPVKSGFESTSTEPTNSENQKKFAVTASSSPKSSSSDRVHNSTDSNKPPLFTSNYTATQPKTHVGVTTENTNSENQENVSDKKEEKGFPWWWIPMAVFLIAVLVGVIFLIRFLRRRQKLIESTKKIKMNKMPDSSKAAKTDDAPTATASGQREAKKNAEAMVIEPSTQGTNVGTSKEAEGKSISLQYSAPSSAFTDSKTYPESIKDKKMAAAALGRKDIEIKTPAVKKIEKTALTKKTSNEQVKK